MTLYSKDHPAAVLLVFSLPLILSGMLQQLYSWADAYIVGHVVGEEALAAVGMTTAVSNLFTMSMTGFTLGLSILAAQKYGKKEYETLPRILSAFLVLLVPACALCAAAGCIWEKALLDALRTPADIAEFTGQYLRVILLGMPFLAVYNLYSALLRAIGDSRTPFFAIVLSSVVNVVLDLVFVAVCRWGVSGAAWATSISQIAMAIFIVWYAETKRPLLHLSLKEKLVQPHIVAQGWRFALPPAVQSSVMALGNMALQQFMNGFGSATVAAVTTAYRIDLIMLLPIINLGSAVSTMVAQSKGAGNLTKAQSFCRYGVALNAVISFLLMVVMAAFGGKLVALFGVGAEAASIGSEFFRQISVYYVCFGIASALRGAVEGIGLVLYSSVVGVASLLAASPCPTPWLRISATWPSPTPKGCSGSSCWHATSRTSYGTKNGPPRRNICESARWHRQYYFNASSAVAGRLGASVLNHCLYNFWNSPVSFSFARAALTSFCSSVLFLLRAKAKYSDFVSGMSMISYLPLPS